MVSRSELLKMLEEAVETEETLVSAWRDKALSCLPVLDIDNDQNDLLEGILNILSKQSLEHKKHFSDLITKIVRSDQDEF